MSCRAEKQSKPEDGGAETVDNELCKGKTYAAMFNFENYVPGCVK